MRIGVLRELSPTLWSAVAMELFERLAYYGMFMVLQTYLVQRIGIRADVYGVILGLFTFALYFFPPFVGALAERFGYRPALAVAFALLFCGYFLLGNVTELPLICAALGLIALGGSIIKPTVAGTVTKTTEEGSTRPVGFGLYYTMVNAGALIGPVVAAQVRNRSEFRYVFWVSAFACAAMLVQALLAYRDPVRAEQGRSEKSLRQVVAEVIMVLGNGRFVLLLVVFSGFWGMINILLGFMQVFVDTFSNLRAAEAAIDSVIPLTRWAGHWLNPEVFLTLDALLIVLFQGAVSYLTRRWKTVRAMLLGTTLATLSWVVPALSPVAGIFALGICIWSLGEMMCSARFFEYCGTVAPRDKVAVYLGYSFLSVCLGNLYSGPWAGYLYQRFVSGPLDTGATPTPGWFFAGVMLMGALSIVGLALYARFFAPAERAR